MPFSLRAAFATLLWAAALLPVVLYVVHLSSPVAAVQIVVVGGGALRWTLAVLIVGSGAALLLYPPFWPSVRLRFGAIRTRLGTDMAPIHAAQSRLEQLETTADRFLVGRALLHLGRADAALGHLRRAVELDPDYHAARYALGLALAAVGRLDEATAELQRVVTAEPAHAFGAAMLEYGVVLHRNRQHEAALEVLQRHAREFGSHRRNTFYRAQAHGCLGQREAALAALREAAKPPEKGRHRDAEEDLIRARAQVALRLGGRYAP